MSKKELDSQDVHAEATLVDVMLRIVALENLLIKKGVLTDEEIRTELESLLSRALDIALKNNQN